MNKMEFNRAFYSASGAYSANTGGGDLSAYGYQQVDGGVWIDSAIGHHIYTRLTLQFYKSLAFR
jgi:hypothetical protein